MMKKKNPWWNPFFQWFEVPLASPARQRLSWKIGGIIESYFFLDLMILFLSKLAELEKFKIYILRIKML
jgi:hypothetical protein